MSFKGRKFTLGVFEGEIQMYVPTKNNFIVKFNGTDLLEVDATTVLNLLVQAEAETKSDEPKAGLALPRSQSSDNVEQNDAIEQTTTSNDQMKLPARKMQQSNINLQRFPPTIPNWMPQMNLQQNNLLKLPSMYTTNPNLFPMSGNSYSNPYACPSGPPPPPMNLNLGLGVNSRVNLSNNKKEVFGYSINMPKVNHFAKSRFQDGMRRHRSVSQPQPVVQKHINEAFTKNIDLKQPTRRRRESLSIPSTFTSQGLNQVHTNSHPVMLKGIPGTFSPQLAVDYRNRFYTQSYTRQPTLPQSTLPQSFSQKPQNFNGQPDATKAEIFKLLRSLYTSDFDRNSLPTYYSLEETLKVPSHINATRLSILRTRNLLRKTLSSVLDLLPCPVEKFVVNSLIMVCPLCAACIYLNKLGSHMNWCKHLISCHGQKGQIMASRFEFFETNSDVTKEEIKDFVDKNIEFKVIEDRPDMAPILEKVTPIGLIPYTTSICFETLLLNNLIKEEVFIEKAILLQEVTVFLVIHYGLASGKSLCKLFPELVKFQSSLKSVSPGGMDFYTSVGHPNLLVHQTTEIDSTPLTMQALKERALALFPESERGSIDWRALLFNKALEDNLLNNCSVIVQEVLVLAFFYYGFITQRTPKKFRIFSKLLAFFGGLYKISCKCYDLYVGVGPTGSAHTRGKPVNPSKKVIQNYNHYGLSRKSLQRTLAKEGKDEAQKVEVKKDDSLSRFTGKGRRGSIKRKNSVQTNVSRRRRSSIKEYIPVASTQLQVTENVSKVTCSGEEQSSPTVVSTPVNDVVNK